ncbi:hypothetical protein Anas_03737 [Armadillidium nasatum]|uniref:Uncharacterized protein n=1 Tax=Armadillidium nasatum TaxID=96803 RepID=A0A5N5TMA1_9CRUS|nr:hypothetical protein Anas_03737 [Armadillidium nasatum]
MSAQMYFSYSFKVCEKSFSVETFERLPSSVVWEELLPSDVPFKVIDAMDTWSVMNEDNFWFDNVTDLYSSKRLINIEPCDLVTNVKIPTNDLQSFFEIIHRREIQSWFGHWENCERKAAKALRYLYKRPYFLPRIVDIWESNWVLMSSNYFSRYYHQLNFSTDLLILAQLRGWNKFRLIPKDPCDFNCYPISGVLAEGQILVVTSLIWELEYKPGEGTDNFAIAVGGFWN